jgi:HK97 family phage prohead protease
MSMIQPGKRTDPSETYTKDNAVDLYPVKADAEKGEFEGYASNWWEVDSYGEATAPGSFTRTIAERGPKADRPRILVRYEHMVTVGRHLEMAEDEKGLKIKAYVSDDGQDGTRLRTHLKDEVPYGISIGYRLIRSRPGTPDDPLIWDHAPEWLRDDNGAFDPARVLVLTEIKSLENSAVSFPAVDQALVDSYRSSEAISLLDHLISDLKAGREIDPGQRRSLERFAAELPAALASDSAGAPSQVSDSDLEYAWLDLQKAMAYARVTA